MNRSEEFKTGRHAGLLLPLFSAVSREGWGIGEIGDIPTLCRWLASAGLDFLQVLPINEMPAGQHSPYGAISAMAIDPVYVTLRDVPEFEAAGGEAGLPGELTKALATSRSATRIDYDTVRHLKMTLLRRSFERFRAEEWTARTPRARDLEAYVDDQRWWLADYALFRALRDRFEARPWWEWPVGLASRDATALARAHAELSGETLFHAWAQWVADRQWQAARHAADPVGLFGDLPFIVGADSADVWASQHAFRLDATVGAPPDAFSDTGQDWGLPVYRWDVFVAEDDAWIRARARRNAALFDGYRVDHLVGFYRTYVIPRDGSPRSFSPPDEPGQLAQGERVMRAFLDSGARIIAEDLGTVPPFVRESLLRLGIPGYKVLRWEREWDTPGQPFRDPLQYPPVSIATTGTHDTETVVEWWESAPPDEREALARIPLLAERAVDPTRASCDRATQDALVELLVASASEVLILPLQDLFGWRDRVNVPATVTDDNWTWRLPWPVEDLRTRPEAVERARQVHVWLRQYHRGLGAGQVTPAEPPAARASGD